MTGWQVSCGMALLGDRWQVALFKQGASFRWLCNGSISAVIRASGMTRDCYCSERRTERTCRPVYGWSRSA